MKKILFLLIVPYCVAALHHSPLTLYSRPLNTPLPITVNGYWMHDSQRLLIVIPVVNQEKKSSESHVALYDFSQENFLLPFPSCLLKINNSKETLLTISSHEDTPTYQVAPYYAQRESWNSEGITVFCKFNSKYKKTAYVKKGIRNKQVSPDEITSFFWSPDGSSLITFLKTDKNPFARAYTISPSLEVKPLDSTLNKRLAPARSATINYRSTALAILVQSRNRGKRIKLYDMKKGKLITTFSCSPFTTRICFSPWADLLASSERLDYTSPVFYAFDVGVRLWDLSVLLSKVQL